MTDALQYVRQLLDGSVDAAVILDEDRRVLHYNRAYEALTGLSGRDLARRVEAGATCFELFSLEICSAACLGCQVLDANRTLRVDEIKAVRGVDGEDMTFIVMAVPIELEAPRRGVIETYRDVTADVRIQRRLKVLLARERRAKETLEDEIRERTQELRQTQAQLVHQEKMSSLGRLVAGIAHELNNPINFVYGNVDFLGEYMDQLMGLIGQIDKADLSPQVRSLFEAKKKEIEFDYLAADSHKLIRSIRSGAERTAAIVQDLKTFSRTGSGDLQEADIVAGIETTLNLIAPLFRNRITIKRTTAPDVPRIICNAGHINQVFMNILTNAVQAIDGAGVIEVDIAPVNDGAAVQVRVTDSGHGIPAEDLARIRDPFFTTKEVGEGTGLGLWITENILRAHGGQMVCSSPPGEGATFVVTLPVDPPESARMSLVASADEPGTSPSVEVGGEAKHGG